MIAHELVTVAIGWVGGNDVDVNRGTLARDGCVAEVDVLAVGPVDWVINCC